MEKRDKRNFKEIQKMTEEEIKMRDNIALVAMQSMLGRKKHYGLIERITMFFKGEYFIDDPDSIAATAYEYAQSMMDERKAILKEESAL